VADRGSASPGILLKHKPAHGVSSE
jgi:hypothetical protein